MADGESHRGNELTKHQFCAGRLDKTDSYAYVESERLGRKSYKEQYVYIYRYFQVRAQVCPQPDFHVVSFATGAACWRSKSTTSTKLKAEGTTRRRSSPGSLSSSAFTPRPHVRRPETRAQSGWNQRRAALDLWSLAVVKDFVLIGQHTCPRNAMKEMEQLYAVVKGMQNKWKIHVSPTFTRCLSKLVDGPFQPRERPLLLRFCSPRTWWSWATSTLAAATSPSKAGRFCA